MSNFKRIKKIFTAQSTLEGAGVRLKRVFGFYQVPDFDPFLLLDDFHSDNPDDYMAGFPWHPHRGIETITYVFKGQVNHGDSLGNSGTISPGEVQWMTAGSGIIHQEMPQRNHGLWGVQLWANLPASHKMMDPRYRDVKASDIPGLQINSKVILKVISGEFNGIKGSVQDIVTEPIYLDVEIKPAGEFIYNVQEGHSTFAYILSGEAAFEENGQMIGNEKAVLFETKGEKIRIDTNEKAVHFLLISGKPINEPIAWRGPIVMNTQEELRKAFEEIQKGTFIKKKIKKK